MENHNWYQQLIIGGQTTSYYQPNHTIVLFYDIKIIKLIIKAKSAITPNILYL